MYKILYHLYMTERVVDPVIKLLVVTLVFLGELEYFYM